MFVNLLSCDFRIQRKRVIHVNYSASATKLRETQAIPWIILVLTEQPLDFARRRYSQSRLARRRSQGSILESTSALSQNQQIIASIFE